MLTTGDHPLDSLLQTGSLAAKGNDIYPVFEAERLLGIGTRASMISEATLWPPAFPIWAASCRGTRVGGTLPVALPGVWQPVHTS